MSGTKSPRGLTRRSFLKTTGVVAGAAMLGGSLAACSSNESSAMQQGSDGDEQVFHGVCRPNCFAYCRLDVHVRDGNIVKTAMHEFEDNPEFNRVCLRGLSHVQRVYDPNRIKYPMKRTGERGENKWERIEWDEALQMVADEFKKAQDTYGPQAVAFWTASGNCSTLHGLIPGITSRLQNVMNATSIGNSVDAALTVGVNRVAGNAGSWVGNEPVDMVNAKTIVAWGANVTDAQVQEWHFLNEALQGGTKLVVVDPTFTQLASKADKWIPVRPGSDPALFLSLMYVVLDEEKQDDDFLADHTVAPFLVNEKTGLFVRMSDMGVTPLEGPVDETTGEPTVVDPYAVWDTSTKSVVSIDDASEPALSAKYDLNGTLCRTAFDLLKDEVMQYPPEIAEGLTEVPVDTIIELAHLCMDGPVTHRVGWGAQAYDNGVHSAHAGITLCALTGNIGKPGASFGANWQISPGVNWAYNYTWGASEQPSLSHLVLREVMRSGKYQGKDHPIKALYIYSGNVLCTSVNTNELINDVINNLDFVVTVDSVFTDTARWSDIILPCAQWFEHEDVIPCGQSHHVEFNEKAIDPLYESKPDGDIVRLLAEKLGHGECFQDSDDEYQSALIDTEYHALFGIDYKTLKDKKAMRYFQYPYIAWEDNTFYTESKRMEFYVEKPVPNGNIDSYHEMPVEREHLPRWFPPAEAWPENELYEKYPFVLLSERPRYRVHSQWFDTQWLRELDPEPTIKINPQNAEEKGIKNGDYVECVNDRGHCVAKAILSEAIRPGTLVYPKSWQAHQHKAGSWSELATSVYELASINQAFMDNLCDIHIWEGGE